MKKVLTSLLLFVGFAAYSQTATATASTQAPAATTLTPKAKELCKNWTLTMTENFGDQHKPTDTQKNDQLVLMDNGLYRMTKEGVAQTGTWALDKSNIWLTLTNMDGTTIKLKIIESTATSLKVDYRDSDDIHNILYYSVAASTSAK